MTTSSYAVRRARLTPTTGLVAWMIANTREQSFAFPKLEQMLFLMDWKLAQGTGKPIVDCQWQHNNEEVSAVGFLKRLADDGHFILTDSKRPEKCRISLARPLENPIDAGIVQAIGSHFRFLNGQAPTALKRMCKDAYPFRQHPRRSHVLPPRSAARLQAIAQGRRAGLSIETMD